MSNYANTQAVHKSIDNLANRCFEEGRRVGKEDGYAEGYKAGCDARDNSSNDNVTDSSDLYNAGLADAHSALLIIAQMSSDKLSECFNDPDIVGIRTLLEKLDMQAIIAKVNEYYKHIQDIEVGDEVLADTNRGRMKGVVSAVIRFGPRDALIKVVVPQGGGVETLFYGPDSIKRLKRTNNKHPELIKILDELNS